MFIKYILSLLFLALHANASANTVLPDTVQVIIPYNAGGIADTQVRHLQEFLQQRKINLVPVNRPGANSLIAAQQFVNSATDGSVIMINSTSNSWLSEHRLNSPVILPIISTGSNSSVIITYPGSKFQNYNDFVAALKSKDPDLNIGWHAVNTMIGIHQLTELLNVDVPLLVPYRTSTISSRDVAGGHLAAALVPVGIAEPLVESGKVTAVVGFGPNGSVFNFRNVPDLRDKFPNWHHGEIFFYGLPPGTDLKIKTAWFDLLKEYLSQPETVQFYKNLYFDLDVGDHQYIESVISNQGKMIKKYNIEIK